MPRSVRAVLILVVALASCSAPPADIDPYQALSGKWGWEGSTDCQEAPLEIRFSQGGKRMHLSNAPATEAGPREPRHVANYTVLGPIPSGLTLTMDGEDRLDASGKPVTWDLFLSSNDQYCWHRSDWRPTGCTKSVDRCKS